MLGGGPRAGLGGAAGRLSRDRQEHPDERCAGADPGAGPLHALRQRRGVGGAGEAAGGAPRARTRSRSPCSRRRRSRWCLPRSNRSARRHAWWTRCRRSGRPTSPARPAASGRCRRWRRALERFAREHGCAMILVGHVTKEGTLAGPRVLEHAVDCVLQFEGERERSFRTLRALKNRFGSTNEIGVFEMRAGGLTEVADPSDRFLRDADPVPGSCVLCAMEGTRPLLVEVQALVAPTEVVPPRRVASGIDRNRLSMILAVLARHGGPSLGACGRIRERRRRGPHRRAGSRPGRRPGDRLGGTRAATGRAPAAPPPASARSASPGSCATSPTPTAASRRRPGSASSGS